MKLAELKTQLRTHPDLVISLSLPDGERAPAHFHVTEVGHVTKKFIDCGGTLRTNETCLLQIWTGRDEDDGHRLTAAKLAHILELATPLFSSDDIAVEVEYERDAISQFPLEAVVARGTELQLRVERKHTDCLAKDQCGARDQECCSGNPQTESDGDPDVACCAATSGSRSCC
jgi:hypothetical protein